eukprot:1156389-Pelagomonas_calceolata.AAC.5
MKWCRKRFLAPVLQIKGYEHQLEAQQQHTDLCKRDRGETEPLHTILPGVGGTYQQNTPLSSFLTSSTITLDHQRAIKLAFKLHGHSVQYAHKLFTTKCAIENKNTSRRQVPEAGASNNPPDPL